jgi:hypothetical protein
MVICMKIEVLKIVKEDVNYLIYFSRVRYGLSIVMLAALIGAPIVYFYNSDFQIALGIIIGMFWLAIVRMVGFSYRSEDA